MSTLTPLIATCVLFTFTDESHAAKKPKRAEALRAIKAHAGARYLRVAVVKPGLGAKDFFALYITKKKKETFTTRGWVARLEVNARGGVRVTSTLRGPTRHEAWHNWEERNDVFRFGWGAAIVKDVDGDGAKELTVFYAYSSKSFRALGNFAMREVVFIRLKPGGKMSQQFHRTLNGGLGSRPYTTKLRYTRRKVGARTFRDLIFTRTNCRTVVVSRHTYDPAKDTWTRTSKRKRKRKVPCDADE